MGLIWPFLFAHCALSLQRFVAKVQTKELRSSFDKFLLFLCKGRKAIATALSHALLRNSYTQIACWQVHQLSIGTYGDGCLSVAALFQEGCCTFPQYCLKPKQEFSFRAKNLEMHPQKRLQNRLQQSIWIITLPNWICKPSKLPI